MGSKEWWGGTRGEYEPMKYDINLQTGAPTAGGTSWGQQAKGEYLRTGLENRGFEQKQQQAWLNEMYKRAMGQAGPSVAEKQMQQGIAQNIAAAQSAAASQRGLTPAQAARLAEQSRAQSTQQGIAQASLLRAQEQMGAAQQYGGLLSGARAQDIQQQQLNDRMRQYYMSQGMNFEEANRRAAIEAEKMRLQQNLTMNQILANYAVGITQPGHAGDVLGFAGQMGAAAMGIPWGGGGGGLSSGGGSAADRAYIQNTTGSYI